MDSIEITIINWDKYNPRKDRAQHNWLRLEKSFFKDPKLFRISDSQRLLLLFLLCEACESRCGMLNLGLDYISHLRKKTEKQILEDLQLLEAIGVIAVTARSPSGNQSVVSGITTNVTNVTNERTNTIAQSFDFANVYQNFPRKVGKEKGIAFLKRSVRTPEEFSLLTHAVKKYREHVASEQTEPRYIKHFSTWVNSWRDWCDEDVGTSIARPKADLSDIPWEG